MTAARKESCRTSRSLAEIVVQECGLSEAALTLLFPVEHKRGLGVAPNPSPRRLAPSFVCRESPE